MLTHQKISHSFYRNFLYRNGFAKVQRSYFRLAVAGILFSSIYIKSHFFEGFGGALGTLALFLYSQLYVFDFILRSTIKKGILMIRKALNRKP
jgi:hypothetical protein